MTESIEPTPSTPGSSPLYGISVRTAGLARPLAGTRWFRLWAVLRHVGRRSGRTYEIPIVAFPTADGFLIPLPFGDSTQWLKNLHTVGSGGLRRAGRDFSIERPEVVDLGSISPELPRPIRFAADRLGIQQFVRVRRSA